MPGTPRCKAGAAFRGVPGGIGMGRWGLRPDGERGAKPRRARVGDSVAGDARIAADHHPWPSLGRWAAKSFHVRDVFASWGTRRPGGCQEVATAPAGAAPF
jgi:hypothetical protein